MTQQEVNALKAKFQAGAYPTQQDFEALIDAIASAGSSAVPTSNIAKIVARLGDTIDNVTYNSYSQTNYVPIAIEDIISSYNIDMTNKDYVVIVNDNFYNGADTSNLYVSCGSATDENVGITVIGLDDAVMFCKFTDSGNNTAYVPVGRSTTITPYALSQLAQENSQE